MYGESEEEDEDIDTTVTKRQRFEESAVLVTPSDPFLSVKEAIVVEELSKRMTCGSSSKTITTTPFCHS